MLDAALALAGNGWRVFPVHPDSRTPRIKGWPDQATQNQDIVARWWAEWPDSWIGIATGRGLVVVDLDRKGGKDGVAFFKAKMAELGIQIPETRYVRSPSGGNHLYFFCEQVFNNATRIWDEDSGVDLRGENGYVIAPPSGGATWRRECEPAQMPAEMAEALTGGITRNRPVGGHSALTDLLQRPPREGGRNEWFAQVLGHLVRGVRFEDGLIHLASLINLTTDGGILSLDEFDEEIPKMAASLLGKEARKTDLEQAEWTSENGYLIGSKGRLWTQVKVDKEWLAVEWGDFDLQVVGVAQDDDKRYWRVVVRPASGGEHVGVLEPGVLADGRRLTAWLAGHGGATILPPLNDRRGAPGTRLIRYMEDQDAPHQQVVPWMGDNDQHGWVTDEGVISADGLDRLAPVIPATAAQTRGVHKYGFGDRSAALHILRETMTFQEEEVSAVFGAWWVACILKGHFFREGAALFPFVAIEGPAETGKTQGFFADMLRLNGSTEGSTAPTTASLRERVAAHRNGIVWIDDLTATAHIQEILRQATAEGTRIKMADDNTNVAVTKLVAPIVISGESLAGFTSEKALVDRAVHLLVATPKNRKSLRDAKRPQWDDRTELVQKYGDYTQFAGTLVQAILERAGMVSEFRTLRTGGGRFGDKVGIMRASARILADLVGDGAWIIERVDDWCSDQQVDGRDDNHLVKDVLPWVLRQLGMPRTPTNRVQAYVDGAGYVWYAESRVLDLWHTHSPGHRLANIESFRAQRHTMGLEGTGRPKRTDPHNPYKKTRYHRLPWGESQRVIEATGETIETQADRHQRVSQHGAIEGVGYVADTQAVLEFKPKRQKGRKPTDPEVTG